MTDTNTEITIYEDPEPVQLILPGGPVTPRNAPAIVKAAGKSAEFAWEEFFHRASAHFYDDLADFAALRPSL